MLVMVRRGFLHKNWYGAVGSILLTVGLSGCGAPHISLPPRPVVIPRPTLDIISPGSLDLNPLTVRDNTPGYLMDQLMWNALVTVRPNGTMAPNLAHSWSMSNKNRRIVLSLDPHAKWWDGRPVTASDVVWSYRLYTNPASGFHRAALLNQVLKSVVAKGPTHVVFSLKVPDPGFLSEYASEGSGVYILPSFLLQRLAVDRVPTSRILANPMDFVGTGPFRPVSQKGTRLMLRAVPRYFKGPPHIADVVLTTSIPVRKNPPETAQLRLDGSLGSTPAVVQQWRHANRVWVLLPNFRVIHQGLADTIIQTISQSVDRTALAQLAHGSPADGPILPSNWSYYPGLENLTPKSTSASVGALSRTTWPITVDRTHSRLSKACSMIVRQTSAAGLHFTCQVLSHGAYRSAVRSGNFQWVLADRRTSAQGWFYRSYRGGFRPPAGNNIGSYNNALVNKWLDAAGLAVNTSSHLADLYQAESALQQDPPGVFLVWPQYAWGQTANLRGIQDNPYVPFYQPQTWRIGLSNTKKK